MRELSLSGKTVILYGPWSQQMVSMWQTLAREGADVGLICEKTDEPQRVCNLINDDREVHPEYGRAVSVALEEPTSLKDAVSKITEAFGGVDIVVDNNNWAVDSKLGMDAMKSAMDKNFWPTIRMYEICEPFFLGRKKGRYVIIVEGKLQNHPSRAALKFLSTREVEEQGVQINFIQPDLTEGYMRQAFPDIAPNIVEEKLGCKITNPDRISQVITFLASSQATGVQNQTIHVN